MIWVWRKAQIPREICINQHCHLPAHFNLSPCVVLVACCLSAYRKIHHSLCALIVSNAIRCLHITHYLNASPPFFGFYWRLVIVWVSGLTLSSFQILPQWYWKCGGGELASNGGGETNSSVLSEVFLPIFLLCSKAFSTCSLILTPSSQWPQRHLMKMAILPSSTLSNGPNFSYIPAPSLSILCVLLLGSPMQWTAGVSHGDSSSSPFGWLLTFILSSRV